MSKHVVVYGRTSFCPDLARSQRFLEANQVAYTQINIDQDDAAGALVEGWVGYRSVPTIVVAEAGSNLPFEEPAPLPAGREARSFDRGTVITEPSDEALSGFLKRNGLLV
ncbi:glutaredoxin domain-containing protein [Herpetosiphon giganteus]|uniref:glutaredoxin domain-containing protein n=1 Tax=Herpetosiphon giganteus TaxID=2029754 RepID=UPI00195CD033|nr:glutaredoxin [Herpetosiphon giganteus]